MEDIEVKKDDLVNNQFQQNKETENKEDHMEENKEDNMEENKENIKEDNKEDNINTEIKAEINKDNINIDNEKRNEDENSEEIKLKINDIFVKKNSENADKDNQNNLLNERKSIKSKVTNANVKSNSIDENDEDIGENYADDFSEKMREEQNIIIGNSNYFIDPLNLKKSMENKKQK